MADVAQVIKEGYLKKRSREGKILMNWRRRYFRLYRDALVYYGSSQDTAERHRIKLTLDMEVMQTNDQGYPLCFAIKPSPSEPNFYIQAENEGEKQAWVTAIFHAARRTEDVAPPAPTTQPTPPVKDIPQARVLLSLMIVEAKKLRAADLNGKSDPYCVINLIGKNGQVIRSEEKKTEIIPRTLDPKWNAKFTIGNVVDLRTVDILHLELWDHDQFTKDTALGFVKVPLSMFRMSHAITGQSEVVDDWFRVEPPQVKSTWRLGETDESKVMTKEYGDLHLIMSIAGPNLVDFIQGSHSAVIPRTQAVTSVLEHSDNRLEVTVLAARDLISADFNNSSDPYCELTLLDAHGVPIRGEKYTTSIKYKTLNPLWDNEHHVFGMISCIEQAAALKVRVLDHDKHSKDDPLGFVLIDLDQLPAQNVSTWYDLQPERDMAIREKLGAIHLKISLVGETRAERNRRMKIDKEVMSKTHEQSVEQLELENAQYQLHDAACKLDGARIPCAVDDYQARHPRFYGINGCIHNLNTLIPRAHRETVTSEESFQARAGLEGQASLEVTVIGTADLLQSDISTSSNPYAVIEVDPTVCIEECKRIVAPLSPTKTSRTDDVSAVAGTRNAMFSKRVQAEVSNYRIKLARNEVRSEKFPQLDPNRPVLKVEVLSGHGLNGVDLSGYSDPYCTLCITDCETGKPVEAEKKRTAVIPKTLNPVWKNEAFIFGNHFPLANAGMLLIHVKDHNNISRSTPLGRLQIPLHELCHELVDSTSITSRTIEKRYPLIPEPWMKKNTQNLGELCIKTEMIGDGKALTELVQQMAKNSPGKMLSFLSFSSFSTEGQMQTELSQEIHASIVSGHSENQGEIIEIIERGKEIRTANVVGNSGKWGKEKFSMSLSYPGMFSDAENRTTNHYTLHLRIHSARNLLDPQFNSAGSRPANSYNPNNELQHIRSSRLQTTQGTTNAYFTVIPVLENGKVEELERKQSLTVYGTRNPYWPDEEFVFGKIGDLSKISYLSLHVYTRDIRDEIKKPSMLFLNAEEKNQEARLKRFQIHKMSASGEVDDDGFEILRCDERVFAFRQCHNGGRFYPARVRKYFPFPMDEYLVYFENSVETVDDLRDFFSLDVKGKIKAIRGDGTADVSIMETRNVVHGPDTYATSIPLAQLIPVNSLSPSIEMIMARRMNLKEEEESRWEKMMHKLSRITIEVLSASQLPKEIQRPGCVITLLGNPKQLTLSSTKNIIGLTKTGELVAQQGMMTSTWKSGERLTFLVSHDTRNEAANDIHLFQLRSLALGIVEEQNISRSDESSELSESTLEESIEILQHTSSVLVRVVDQGQDPEPLDSHPTIGFVRLDLAAFHSGEHELQLNLIPPENVPYYKDVGSVFIRITCSDESKSKDEAELVRAIKASSHSAALSNTLNMHGSLHHLSGWYHRRLSEESLPSKSSRVMSRIERRRVLRSSLTPTENSQLDTFKTVLVIVMKRIVSILREIRRFEEFEAFGKEEMMKCRHVHTVNADSSNEWIGRMLNEMNVETRRDIVAHLEMELLDLSAADVRHVYPAADLPREEWLKLRTDRQKALEKAGGFFMKDRTNSFLLTVPCCFTGEGMISWILRGAPVLWQDQWIKYCFDPYVRSLRLRWQDPNLEFDPDAIQAPKTREQALMWLNALCDAGFIEHATASSKLTDSNRQQYLFEDKADRFYRVREVEMWADNQSQQHSLFPLDLVQELDYFTVPSMSALVENTNVEPSTGTVVEPTRKNVYAKKLTEHLEGFLGTSNMLSSLLFAADVAKHTLLQPVVERTQKMMDEQVLWDWKYCLFIPSRKIVYMYENEMSDTPIVIIDMSSGACRGAFNFVHDDTGEWIEIVNATVLTIQPGTKKFVPINDSMKGKMMKTRDNGDVVMEFKARDAQTWIHAFARAGIRIDMRPGQLVILKQLNPAVLMQKCIDHETDFNPNDLEGSFQRLLNRAFGHHVKDSHHEYEKKTQKLRAQIRNELKKPGKVGDAVLAYYGKGKCSNAKSAHSQNFTANTLYSAEIVRIRTPYTDTNFHITELYNPKDTNIPQELVDLLVKYKVHDKVSWLNLPISLRDLFLLYDVEYHHGHERIREEGLLREHIRASNGDLDPIKVEERCTDLNLLFKPNDLEGCITRMVALCNERKQLGHLKIPVKMVSPHRVIDVWYSLAPDKDMVQKVQLGQIRIQLRLVETKQLKRSMKVPGLLADVKEVAMKQQSTQPFGLSASYPFQKFKGIMAAKNKRTAPLPSSNGFTISKEQSFVKIKILEARKLMGINFTNGSSDPFVKLVLLNEGTEKEENTRMKTDIKSKTLNPKWENQEFVLGKTEITALSDKKAILLRVMDHDLASKSRPLGCVKLEFQRDTTGFITGLLLVQADPSGNAAYQLLPFDNKTRVEVDAMLLTDEKMGQSRSAKARNNSPDIDGKLGKLRFAVEIEKNNNFVDPTALGNSGKTAAFVKQFETHLSLEIAIKKVMLAGKSAAQATASNTTDWSLYTCIFLPKREGGQHIHFDGHSEDLASGKYPCKLSELLQLTASMESLGNAPLPAGVSPLKVLGRTFDISKAAFFDVSVSSDTLGKHFEGKFAHCELFNRLEMRPHLEDQTIVLMDKTDKDLELHMIVDVRVIVLHGAERVKRLLQESFRLVGVPFDVKTMNRSTSSVENTQGHDIQAFMWEVCRANIFPSRSVANDLVTQLHLMSQSSKLHWKFTPQLLGYIYEIVFCNGDKDRLSYKDAVALDRVLKRWSHVLAHVNDAKTQLTGHLHGKETPRLIHALFTKCDWTGFEFASFPVDTDTHSNLDTQDTSQSKRLQSILRPGNQVHVLLPPYKHAGIAVDVRLPNNQYVAGTIICEYGDNKYDVAFCTSAKVRDEGDEYFSDEDELPPLTIEQTVFVCPLAQAEMASTNSSNTVHSHALQPGRIGKVDQHDELGHPKTPYLVVYCDDQEPKQEWMARVCLDSMFPRVDGNNLHTQLHREDFVRVSGASRKAPNSSTDGVSNDSMDFILHETGAARPGKIIRNHGNAKYAIEYLDGLSPPTELFVSRDRLEPISDQYLYSGEVQHVYLTSGDALLSSTDIVVNYDVLLINGELAEGLRREQLRLRDEYFTSDNCVLGSIFVPKLNIEDAKAMEKKKSGNYDTAKKLKELWGKEQIVKTYILLPNEAASVQLRDNTTNKLLQAELSERIEEKPRFLEQCHGFVKKISPVEVAKLTQLYAAACIHRQDDHLGGSNIVADTEPVSLNVDNCFCLYLAPQPRVELHGTVRVSPLKASMNLFRTLLDLALKEPTVFTRLFQRLLRSIATMNMPLNRKERLAIIQELKVCFYRKPVQNVTLNAVPPSCDGQLIGEEGTPGIQMNRVPLTHVSISIRFHIAFPHNNRGSMAEAVEIAYQDGIDVQDRLALQNMLTCSSLPSDANSMEKATWSFENSDEMGKNTSPLNIQNAVSIEITDRHGKNGTKPELSLELLPLEDFRISVKDMKGINHELCLSMEKILVEAQLRRHLSPLVEAKVLDGPHYLDAYHPQMHQVNKQSQKWSMLLTQPNNAITAKFKEGERLHPYYRLEYLDTHETQNVSLSDIKFDALTVAVQEVSQMIVHGKSGAGDIIVEVLLISSDFEQQLVNDQVLTTPFGLLLSPSGEICKDLMGNTYPANSTFCLIKSPNNTSWVAHEKTRMVFQYPSIDLQRISGVKIVLKEKATKNVIGTVHVPIEQIGRLDESSEQNPQDERDSNARDKNTRSQAFSVYHEKHGRSRVVGKMKLEVFRTQHVRLGHTVLSKRIEKEEDSWLISSYELLATTLKQKQELHSGGLLGDGRSMLQDPVEQELQLQRIANVMMVSQRMETLYATKIESGADPSRTSTTLLLKDRGGVKSSRALQQLKQTLRYTKWIVEDTAAEFGITTAGKRLPWSIDPTPLKNEPRKDKFVVFDASVSTSTIRLRRVVLKLYHVYRYRLIPTLQRLRELDAMGDFVNVTAAEQLLRFFEDEVEDLDHDDHVVYRRVYQRLRLMKITQVLEDIMRTTLRVKLINQNPDTGNNLIGIAHIPLLDLLDQMRHDMLYELFMPSKTPRTSSLYGNEENYLTAPGSPRAISSPKTLSSPGSKSQGKIHLQIQLRYSESSLLEQAIQVYKSLKTRYILQHETARRRINVAVVPAQRRRWMTIKGYLEELKAQSTGKLDWERTPVLLNLVWDIFVSHDASFVKTDNPDEEEYSEGLVQQVDEYRSAIVQVHTRWANLQPKLDELLRIQAAIQIHAQRTPQLLDEIEKEVEGLDIVLSTAWQQVHDKWTILLNALQELMHMQESKLHLSRAPTLLKLVSQQCSKGLSKRHAEAVSNVQFRWMALTQRDGPLYELRLMENAPLHWRRTHELILLLNEQCEGFADVDARALEVVQRRWEQAQEWLDDVVQMLAQHKIDCEATPFILKKLQMLDDAGRSRASKKRGEKLLHTQSPISPSHKIENKSSRSPTSDGASNQLPTSPRTFEGDVDRLEGLAEWYAIEEAKYELERIPYHRITTDYDRNNWLPYSQDGKDTRLLITQEEMVFTPANVRLALEDRGVIPKTSDANGSFSSIVSSDRSFAKGSSHDSSTALPKEIMDEINELENALESTHDPQGNPYAIISTERIAELFLVIESLGKSDLLWKVDHVVNINKELEVPSSFFNLLEEMRIRQIPTNEIENLVRTLTVMLQKEELARAGIGVPSNANYTSVLALMQQHQIKDVMLPVETSAIQTLLQERGMDRKGEAVFLRGMRIGTQLETADGGHTAGDRKSMTSSMLNTNLGILDTQIELLRKSLLVEALQKRNSLIKTFPGDTKIFSDEEVNEATEVDMSGDYMTLIERFQQLLIHESYTKRLAEYAALDRCMRALLDVSRDKIVTKEDIALKLHSLKNLDYRLPLEAFTREELTEAAQQGKIRTPTEQMLARCPCGKNAKAMAYYAAVSHAAMVFQEITRFHSRVDPVTQRLKDSFSFEDTSSLQGMSIPKRRSQMDLKQSIVNWLLGNKENDSESVVQIQRRLSAYHRQRLLWASSVVTLRNRWFQRGFGWCDSDPSKGVGVKVLMQRLLLFETANKMHMNQTEALLREVDEKCINLRARERAAKEGLEQQYQKNMMMLKKLVSQAERCINNRKLHTEETPALLHAIEQVCVVPGGLSDRHREAYHVVTSHWLPHRARLAELVQMHKEGTFSVHRTPELLNAMEFHTEGIAGSATRGEENAPTPVDSVSGETTESDQETVAKKLDEIRREERKVPSSLQLDIDSQSTTGVTMDEDNNWLSLSPSKRIVQPLSPREKQTSWKVVTKPGEAASVGKQTIVLENKGAIETGGRHRRRSSLGDELKELMRSPSKWLMGTSGPVERIRAEDFFPRVVSHDTNTHVTSHEQH